jgi:hypothetical protein
MDEEVKLWFDTAFTTEDIWDDENDEIKGKIRLVLPSCFKTGEKLYEMINGYNNLPWKTKHHLDIRMEMNNDLKNNK